MYKYFGTFAVAIRVIVAEYAGTLIQRHGHINSQRVERVTSSAFICCVLALQAGRVAYSQFVYCFNAVVCRIQLVSFLANAGAKSVGEV
jgi:hypothetical protein